MRLSPYLISLAALPILGFGACSSDTIENLVSLQDRIDTIEDCFPDLIEKAGYVVEITDMWRVTDSGAISDPPGLTSVIQGGGTSLLVTYDVPPCQILMTITFHAPDGSPETITFGGETTLAEQMEVAVAALIAKHGSNLPFILGEWDLDSIGSTTTGSGFLAGELADGPAQLAKVATTNGNTSGGFPSTASGSIVSTGTTNCSLLFRTAGLITEMTPNQAYPIGDLSVTVSGAARVVATVSFDGTQDAVITANGIPGSFDWDLMTGSVTYNP